MRRLAPWATDVMADEIAAWQSSQSIWYPILYTDAIRIEIRDGGAVANKAARGVIGVDVDGIKQVLGIWIQQIEGPKFWHGVLASRWIASVLTRRRPAAAAAQRHERD